MAASRLEELTQPLPAVDDGAAVHVVPACAPADRLTHAGDAQSRAVDAVLTEEEVGHRADAHRVVAAFDGLAEGDAEVVERLVRGGLRVPREVPQRDREPSWQGGGEYRSPSFPARRGGGSGAH